MCAACRCSCSRSTHLWNSAVETKIQLLAFCASCVCISEDLLEHSPESSENPSEILSYELVRSVPLRSQEERNNFVVQNALFYSETNAIWVKMTYKKAPPLLIVKLSPIFQGCVSLSVFKKTTSMYPKSKSYNLDLFYFLDKREVMFFTKNWKGAIIKDKSGFINITSSSVIE